VVEVCQTTASRWNRQRTDMSMLREPLVYAVGGGVAVSRVGVCECIVPSCMLSAMPCRSWSEHRFARVVCV